MAEALFWVFAAAAVLSALGVILNVRNTVGAAVNLVVTMLAIATRACWSRRATSRRSPASWARPM